MSGSPASQSRGRLLHLLTERSFAKKEVTLASGKKSDFFIDCKQTVLSAEGHALVGALMFEALPPCDAVAGVELGGCPLASAVSLVSFQRQAPRDAIYVRKEAKDHGSKRLLEGDAHLKPSSRVAILEDVVTTGGSTLKAAEKIRAANHEVVAVVALIDRLEGGRAAIEAAGLPLVTLFTRADFPS
jgi:orotate phosphoribosyltransferase